MHDFMAYSSATQYPLVQKVLGLTRPLSMVIILFGLLALIGYAFSIEMLYRPWENGPATNPLTAVITVCLGIALYCNQKTPSQKRTQAAFAAIAGLLALLGIADFLLNTELVPYVTPFYQQVTQDIAHNLDNKMGLNTAVMLFVISISVLLYNLQYYSCSQMLAITVAFIPFTSIVGYLYGYDVFYGHMSLITVFIGMVLSASATSMTADKALISAILSPFIAGKVARYQILVGYAVPVLCGYIFLSFLGASKPTLVSLFAVLTCWLIHILVGISAIFTEIENKKRREYQDELNNKTVELESILGSLPVGVMRLTPNLDYLYVNRWVSDNAKAPSPPRPGLNLRDVSPPDVIEKFSDVFGNAKNGETINFNFEIHHVDGSTYYRDVIAIPEPDNFNNVKSILCIITDRTDLVSTLHQEKEALKQVENYRKSLNEHAIVAITDVKGVITSVNQKFSIISQYSAEELIGNTHNVINSGYHSKSFFKDMWQTISKGLVWHGDICNRAKDGSLYWVNTTIVPLVNEKKKPYQYIAIRADITERKAAEEKIRQLAYNDELTLLPNRRSFRDYFENILSESSFSLIALFIIDIDHFKKTNDLYGHDTGDALLIEVANRLQEWNVQPNIAARLSGDEFVVCLVNNDANTQSARDFLAEEAKRIQKTLSTSYVLNGNNYKNTVSIGCVISDNTSIKHSVFLKQADIALYEAKAKGRNQANFFNPKLESSISRRYALTVELEQALERNEMALVYQPIFNRGGHAVIFEALLRWNNKTLGMVSPAEFIPIAEQSMLIIQLGNWVLKQVSSQLERWAKESNSQKWKIAVNLSARQIAQPDFIDSVKRNLTQYDISPSQLELEITEYLLQANIDETIKKMTELNELGVTFSLDDFGTGYSSLSYLANLPVQSLKIDRSFVTHMLANDTDMEIVKSILSLSKSLSLTVTAEGIETQEQLDFLMTEGCQNFQGYLLSKPVPADSLPQRFTMQQRATN